MRPQACNKEYAHVSSHHNQIHVSLTFSNYANLPGTMTSGMFPAAAARILMDPWAADSNTARVRSSSCSFVGTARNNDCTEAKLHHAGIVSCRKIIKAEATNKEAEEKVLAGERKLVKECQPIYLLAKEVGARYGMSLCHSSPIVREAWDMADIHLWKLMVAQLPCYSPSPY